MNLLNKNPVSDSAIGLGLQKVLRYLARRPWSDNKLGFRV